MIVGANVGGRVVIMIVAANVGRRVVIMIVGEAVGGRVVTMIVGANIGRIEAAMNREAVDTVGISVGAFAQHKCASSGA